jgi:hypothetical protein
MARVAGLFFLRYTIGAMKEMPQQEWEPRHPSSLEPILSGLAINWWVAGGWALDLFTGKQFRAHYDTDILILRRDQLIIQKHLSDWQLFKTKQPGLAMWRTGETLRDEINDIWCRENDEAPFRFQIMLMETDGEEWVYRRAPQIRGPIESLGMKSKLGLPIIRPEIQLLYKSARYNKSKDDADFEATLPHLSKSSRKWLKHALEIQYPNGHCWMDKL